MKTINTICLYVIVAIAIIGSFFIDAFEDIHEKYFKDDGVATLLTVVAILATVLTIVGLFYHFDIPTLFRDYYFELCRQIPWS